VCESVSGLVLVGHGVTESSRLESKSPFDSGAASNQHPYSSILVHYPVATAPRDCNEVLVDVCEFVSSLILCGHGVAESAHVSNSKYLSQIKNTLGSISTLCNPLVHSPLTMAQLDCNELIVHVSVSLSAAWCCLDTLLQRAVKSARLGSNTLCQRHFDSSKAYPFSLTIAHSNHRCVNVRYCFGVEPRRVQIRCFTSIWPMPIACPSKLCSPTPPIVTVCGRRSVLGNWSRFTRSPTQCRPRGHDCRDTPCRI
jgi:hypothetical protein